MDIFSESRWIWPDNHFWDIQNGYALFRQDFELAEVAETAPLYITADQSYHLYINGTYVSRGPARGFQKSWPYDEIDVAAHLQTGRNVIAVRAYNPGASNFQYLTHGWAGLLVAATWGNTRLHSDKTWRCTRQAGVKRGTVPTSLQLFPQEHIDLRLEDPDWMLPDYDDSGWSSHVAEHIWNGMPWPHLEPRGIPMLEESVLTGFTCLGVSEGNCAPAYLTTRDVTRTRFAEGLAHGPATLAKEEIIVPPTGIGQFRSYLIDLGKTSVGCLGFTITGAAGGEILDTLCVETIDEGTLTPDYIPDKHCRMAFGSRLICRVGKQFHEFYHAFGFRYFVLTVRDSLEALSLTPFLRSTLYPFIQEGSFYSSRPGLDELWSACAWTQRVCSLDAYVDTPWREQAQWWGDARVQAKNTFFYSGDTRLLRRGIAQIAAQTTPEGLTYGHAPTMAHSCILPDFSLIWLVTLVDYHWQTGSLEPLFTHEDTVRGILRYFEDQTDPRTGLVGHDPRYWLFLDWTDIFKEGFSTVYNLWLLIALERLAGLYELGDRLEAVAHLTAWAARLRQALGRVVIDGLLCDGLTPGGEQVTTTSVHAQTLAIIAGFRPEHNEQRLTQVLLPFIRQEIIPSAYPSAYWITYVFEVLTAAGHGAEIIPFIEEKWAPMARHGTTWENFKPKRADESFSHAWSAHPLYHLMQTLGGIRQNAPGWTSIIFQPVFLGDSADVTVPSPPGKIHATWKRTAGTIEVSLSLPETVVAKVILPGLDEQEVTGKTSWKITAP